METINELTSNGRKHVAKFLGLIQAENSVMEVRILNARNNIRSDFKSTYSGYFDNLDTAVKEVVEMDQCGLNPPAIYVTLNPVKSDLLTRAANHLEFKVRHTTKDEEILPTDPLNFKDRKKYTDRLKAAQEKTGLTEAIRVGLGKIDNIPVSFGVMDFRFIGGSMGSVVGERVARAIERSMDLKIPLVIVCASGGARMQEGILSLMQMAKTSALLAKHDDMGLPYISILTNPTTAGVMASYASLGDVIIAEPKALLGFAGPRVIQQTIGQELPPGFQSSEFFQEHGFVDMVVPRPHLRSTLITLLRYLYRPADQIPPLGEE